VVAEIGCRRGGGGGGGNALLFGEYNDCFAGDDPYLLGDDELGDAGSGRFMPVDGCRPVLNIFGIGICGDRLALVVLVC